MTSATFLWYRDERAYVDQRGMPVRVPVPDWSELGRSRTFARRARRLARRGFRGAARCDVTCSEATGTSIKWPSSRADGWLASRFRCIPTVSVAGRAGWGRAAASCWSCSPEDVEREYAASSRRGPGTADRPIRARDQLAAGPDDSLGSGWARSRRAESSSGRRSVSKASEAQVVSNGETETDRGRAGLFERRPWGRGDLVALSVWTAAHCRFLLGRRQPAPGALLLRYHRDQLSLSRLLRRGAARRAVLAMVPGPLLRHAALQREPGGLSAPAQVSALSLAGRPGRPSTSTRCCRSG